MATLSEEDRTPIKLTGGNVVSSLVRMLFCHILWVISPVAVIIAFNGQVGAIGDETKNFFGWGLAGFVSSAVCIYSISFGSYRLNFRTKEIERDAGWMCIALLLAGVFAFLWGDVGQIEFWIAWGMISILAVMPFVLLVSGWSYIEKPLLEVIEVEQPQPVVRRPNAWWAKYF